MSKELITPDEGVFFSPDPAVVQQMTDHVAAADPHPVYLTAAEAQAMFYPVGSLYYQASVATNPGTLLGFGTWVAFGAGRVPVGHNAADVDFDTVEETGGAKTHTHTGPSHVHTGPSHDHSVNPPNTSTSSDNHSHTVDIAAFNSGGSTSNAIAVEDAGTTFSYATGAHLHSINPPNTGTSADAHGHTVDIAAFNSALDGTGNTGAGGTGATGDNSAIAMPYIVVYIWKRTA